VLDNGHDCLHGADRIPSHQIQLADVALGFQAAASNAGGTRRASIYLLTAAAVNGSPATSV
jgi:hypothetical protein